MEKIKTLFSIIYDDASRVEAVSLFDDVKEYESTVSRIEEYIDNPQSFDFNSIRLTPYNEDINSSYLATDIILNLNNIRCIYTTCEVIKYEEPII